MTDQIQPYMGYLITNKDKVKELNSVMPRQSGIFMQGNPEKAEAMLNDMYEVDLERLGLNQRVHAKNEELREKTIQSMLNMGLSAVCYSYRNPYTKRDNKRRKQYEAPWHYGINYAFADNSHGVILNEANLNRRYRDYRERIDNFNTEKKARELRHKKKLEKDERMLADAAILFGLSQKYGTDPDYWEVKDAILMKSKYLHLADAMMMLRDYGYEYWDNVRLAIAAFVTETDTDLEISNEVREVLEYGYDDHRVFRDTKWSYDKLFEMVNEIDSDLHDDYCKISDIKVDY